MSRVDEWAARSERLEGHLGNAADKTTWEANLTRQRLGRLVAARESLELQASVDWHRYAAEAEYEMGRLQGLVDRLGLPGDLLPENELELLSRQSLVELKASYTRSLAEWEKRAASNPLGLIDRPIDQLKARLAKVDQALGKPPVDLMARVAELPRAPKVSPELAAWVNQSPEVRAATVDRIEHELLKKSLALDDTNVAAEMRLAELERRGAGGGVAETVARNRGRLAMERARGFSPDPRPGSSPRSPLVRDMVKNRFNDPVKAIESEALLTRQWEQLRAVENPAVRSQLLAESSDRSVVRWAVGHMTDEDLAEAMTYAKAGRQRLAAIRAERSVVMPGQQHLHYDLDPIEAEIKALDEEFAFRAANGGRASAAAPDLSSLDPETRELLARHATETTADLARTPAGRQTLYEAQQRYLARAVEPNPMVAARRDQLQIQGLQDEVDRLVRDAREYRKFRVDLTASDLDAPVGPGGRGFNEKLSAAGDALQARAARLREGVQAASKLDPEASAGLAARIDQAMNGKRGPPPPPRPGPNGPVGPAPAPTTGPRPVGPAPGTMAARPIPSNTAPVQPFGDPRIVELRATYTQSMGDLARSVESGRMVSRPVAAETPNISFDVPQPVRVFRATIGERPALQGWMTKQKTAVPFRDIIQLKSTRILPGGVALGVIPEVEGSWTDAGLLYDRSLGRLVFLKPSGERVRLPEVDPAVLKTCYLFSRSEDSVATSIGYAGESGQEHWSSVSRVLLHPVLRDTQIGLDVIDADRLAWGLKSETLPNGAPNPFVENMRDRVIRAGTADLPVQPLLERLAKVADVNVSGVGPARLRRLRETALRLLERTPWHGIAAAIQVEAGSGEAQAATVYNELMLRLVWEIRTSEQSPWEFACAAALIFASRPENAGSSLRSLAPPFLHFIDSTRLSLLTDDSLRLRRSGGDMHFESRLRIRYVHGRIEATPEALRRLDTVVEDKDSGEAASRLIPRLEQVYPSLARTREYAQWIGLMRWAQQDGHVEWLDLADLRTVDHHKVSTPDYLIRGSDRQMREAVELFGLARSAK
jgi:hypothetical protein